MIRYDEAMARIRAGVAALPAVELPPLRLLGCHLAEPLVAPMALPPCDDSAMDGFAVCASATAGASRAEPRLLAAGREAAAIATGDPMPAGFDAVAPIEWVRVAGERIEVFKPVEVGANVRRRGEDVQAGDVIAPAGARIDAGSVLAASSLGLTRLRAHRRVRAAVLPVGHHLAAGRPDATGPAVVASLRAWGAAARLLPAAFGGAAAVSDRIAHAMRTADFVITCGAASVGESDVVPAAVESLGARVLFHGVSIKPGKPIGVATYEGRTLLMLPGSPTAALAGLEGIGRTVFACLAGDPAGRAPVAARLASPLRRRKGKTGLLRGSARMEGGHLVFEPAAKQGPAQISAVAGTNALAVIPADAESIDAGAEMQVLLLGVPEARIAPAMHERTLVVCGWSGSGKTWVVQGLVRRLTAAGLRVATVKHDGCGEEAEPADKDTALHREAGAIASTLIGTNRTITVGGASLSLEQAARDHLARGADLVIAEGFKAAEGLPKIEVTARGRDRVHASPLFALVTDRDEAADWPIVRPDETGLDALAGLVLRSLRQAASSADAGGSCGSFVRAGSIVTQAL